MLTLVPVVAPAKFRVSPEDRARVQKKIEQDRALSQLIRVAKSSKIFLLRRTAEGEVMIRPTNEGAAWEDASDELVRILDHALDGQVSELEDGSEIRISAKLGDRRMDLELAPEESSQ